jgi:predicted enzyme related to lactoylglutathione lyase
MGPSVYDGHAREALSFYERVFGWTTRLSEIWAKAAALHRVPARRAEHRRRLLKMAPS